MPSCQSGSMCMRRSPSATRNSHPAWLVDRGFLPMSTTTKGNPNAKTMNTSAARFASSTAAHIPIKKTWNTIPSPLCSCVARPVVSYGLLTVCMVRGDVHIDDFAAALFANTQRHRDGLPIIPEPLGFSPFASIDAQWFGSNSVLRGGCRHHR